MHTYDSFQIFFSIQKIVFKLFVATKNRHYLTHTNWISASLLSVFSLLSLSRIFALYLNYSAPISTWMHISYLIHAQPEIYSAQAKWDQGKFWEVIVLPWKKLVFKSLLLGRSDEHLHRQGVASVPLVLLSSRAGLESQISSLRISRTATPALPGRRGRYHHQEVNRCAVKKRFP